PCEKNYLSLSPFAWRLRSPGRGDEGNPKRTHSPNSNSSKELDMLNRLMPTAQPELGTRQTYPGVANRAAPVSEGSSQRPFNLGLVVRTVLFLPLLAGMVALALTGLLPVVLLGLALFLPVLLPILVLAFGLLSTEEESFRAAVALASARR